MQINRIFEEKIVVRETFFAVFLSVAFNFLCAPRPHVCFELPSSVVNAKDGCPWFIHREVVECLMAYF